MPYNPFDMFVLFGAIQGFTLGFYLYPKRKVNPRAYWFFILFLYSLAVFNLVYAFILMGFPIFGALPIPFKYLIGAGFYFFIRSHLPKASIRRIERLIFLPALIYGMLRGYWFYIKISGINPDIIRQVYFNNFFVYNEFLCLVFDLILIWLSLLWIYKLKQKLDPSRNNRENWRSLLRFSYLFLAFTGLRLFHLLLTIALQARDNPWLFIMSLLLNTLFIYGIGFYGFARASSLLKALQLKEESPPGLEGLSATLDQKMKREKAFLNSQLKLNELARQLDTSPSQLSQLIRRQYQMNFSEYLNYHRVEQVKQLLLSPEAEKYTILHLAQLSGFNSKSSFQATFKKMTGLTPRAYRQTQEKVQDS